MCGPVIGINEKSSDQKITCQGRVCKAKRGMGAVTLDMGVRRPRERRGQVPVSVGAQDQVPVVVHHAEAEDLNGGPPFASTISFLAGMNSFRL